MTDWLLFAAAWVSVGMITFACVASLIDAGRDHEPSVEAARKALTEAGRSEPA